jgi:hypothetical protein
MRVAVKRTVGIAELNKFIRERERDGERLTVDMHATRRDAPYARGTDGQWWSSPVECRRDGPKFRVWS